MLVTLGVLAGLLLLEGILRLSGITEPRPTGYAPVATDFRAGRPRNARGYRDNERALSKATGVKRLLVLGDSFTWGASVEFEDAWPQRLERGLVRRRGEPWEVVTLALPGLALNDYAAQLAAEGMAYSPDAIAIGYCLNDAESKRAMKEREAGYVLSDRRNPFLEQSALFRFVAGRLRATAIARERLRYHRQLYDDKNPDWAEARGALQAIGRLSRERGVPWLVVVFPLFGNPLDDSYPFLEAHQKIALEAEKDGAKVLDLLPAYRGLRAELLVVDGVRDEHPNEIAHRIAAGAALRALDELLPQASR